MRLITLCVLTFFTSLCFGQSDTSIVYLAKGALETSKDSAYTYMQFYRQNNLWHGKEFYLKNGRLKSEGDYTEKSVNTPTGAFNNYTETGKLDFTDSYSNGKPDEVTYYYKSGSRKSWVLFNGNEVKQQKGWDES